MKILLDTNIILDYILKREPFFENARIILRLASEQKIHAYISASAVTDIYYLVQKAKNKDYALNFIRELIKFIKIAGVDKNVIEQALNSQIRDFEDAVQNATAENINIKQIITRNIKDYKNSTLKIISPDNFTKNWKA